MSRARPQWCTRRVAFCIGTDDFSQFCVEIPEVLRPQLGELVVTQCREDALDVLPVAADGGLRQLAGSDVRQPQVDVFCQRELLDGLRRVAALPLKEDCLSIEPLFDLPGRQSSGGWTVFCWGLMRLPL